MSCASQTLKCSLISNFWATQTRSTVPWINNANMPVHHLSFSICTHLAKRSTGIFWTKHPVDLEKMHLGEVICSALSVMRVCVLYGDNYMMCTCMLCMYIYLRILVLTATQNSSDLWWVTIQEGMDVWISLLSITPFHRWGPHEVSGISRVKCALRDENWLQSLKILMFRRKLTWTYQSWVLAIENNCPSISRGFLICNCMRFFGRHLSSRYAY